MSKLHNDKFGTLTTQSNYLNSTENPKKKEHVIITTYWRAKNPKVSKVKKKSLMIKNRFEFGNDAPIRYRNFGALKKNKRKDYFKVQGKDYIEDESF